MADLQYYHEEHARFAAEFATKLTDREAWGIYPKLQSKYKIKSHYLVFRGNRGGGRCDASRIRLSHDPSVGLFAHEIAHAIQFRKNRLAVRRGVIRKRRWHTKAHVRLMAKVSSYIMANLENWRADMSARSQKKAEQEQAKNEKLRQEKERRQSPEFQLEHLRKLEKRAVTRAKRAETTLKKIRQKIRRWERKQSTGVSTPVFSLFSQYQLYKA